MIGLSLVFLADVTGLFNGIDFYFYDLCFRLRGDHDRNRNIVIISIDEKTLSKLGRWPIKRSYYTRLIDLLTQARAVGLDIILAEPSPDDLELGHVIKRHGRVVLPVYFDGRLKTSSPVSHFSSAGTGHIHLEQDIDGVVRKVFHNISNGSVTAPSFSTALLALIDPEASKGIGTTFKSGGPLYTKGLIQRDPMFINYYGPSGRFPYISLSDVLEGKWPPGFFKDRIVLIGLTAAGIEEDILTPFTEDRNRMPGVEAHAHCLNNLLDHSYIRVVHDRTKWSLVFIISLFSLFALAPLKAGKATGLYFLGMAALLVAIFVLFSMLNQWVAPASFLFALTLVFILGYIFNLERMGLLLREAKEDWEDSFNTIKDAITVHDRECNVVRKNEAAANIFGEALCRLLKSRCLVFQGALESSSGPGRHPRPRRVGKEVVEEIYDADLEKYLEIKSIPRFDRRGHFNGMVQIVRDISERIRNQEEQRTLQTQLIQAQKMEAIGTLAGGIAHDFNNILSAIIGYTELAFFDIPEGSKARDRLDEVLRGGNRAKDLINQILAFSRQSKQEKKPVQVGLILKEVLRLIKSTLPSSIEIRSEVATKGMILGDPTQIHQIIMNLCTNAYHAMQDDGGVLSVLLTDVETDWEEGSWESQAGPYIKLTVSDTGQGIPRGILRDIFDPYFTTKKQGEGTGLGLAVVNGIVKAHGGSITVKSEPGTGTVFDILLPRIEREDRDRDEDMAPLPTGTERILLIDDEEALSIIGREMLERLGYDVTASTGSIGALNIFRERPEDFDLVITDMTMPHMTGADLARELMSIRRDIPVILCTGFSEKIDETKARSMGIKALIKKPIVMRDLAENARRVLDAGKKE